MDCVCFAVSKMLEFFGKRQRNQHKFEQTLLRNLSGEDSSFGLSDIHRSVPRCNCVANRRCNFERIREGLFAPGDGIEKTKKGTHLDALFAQQP